MCIFQVVDAISVEKWSKYIAFWQLDLLIEFVRVDLVCTKTLSLIVLN